MTFLISVGPWMCVVYDVPLTRCERPPQYATAPCKLIFDFLILKVVSESRVTWATSVLISVFLDVCSMDLGPMYGLRQRQTEVRQNDVRRASSLA